MIKKLLLVSLIATSGYAGLYGMKKPEKGQQVNLTVDNYLVKSDAADTLIDTETSSKTSMGNQSNVEILSDRNFGAMFVNDHYKKNAKVGKNNKVIVKGSDTKVENYYASENESIVFLIDTNNKLIGHAGVVNGSTLSAETLSDWISKLGAPTGYTIDSKVYDGNGTSFTAGVTTINSNLILKTKLVYDDSYATYQVAVFGDTASLNSIDGDGVAAKEVDVNFDKRVKATSTAEDFSYWKIGDRIVSYEKEYTFSIYSDVVLEEVTGEASVEKKPIINLYHNEANDDMSIHFICGYELAPGYSYIEAGMLFGGETYDTAAHRVAAEAQTTDNEFAVKYSGDDSDSHVAYLVYKNDATGDISVIYDNGYGYEQLCFWNVGGSNNDPVDSKSLTDLITTTSQDISLSVDGKVYPYIDDAGSKGVRIGSGSGNGTVTITLPEGKTANKVYIGGRQWDDDEKTLMVNSVETSKFPASFTLDEVAISDSNTITITEGEGRAEFNYIGFAYSDSNTTPAQREADKIFDKVSIGNENSVYEGTTLPTEMDGYDIAWTLADNSVTEIQNSDIPETENVTKTFTASITIGEQVFTRDYTVTLVSKDNTLAAIKSWVLTQDTFGNLDNITENLVLPSKYDDTDLTLTWTSSNAAITNEGVVTRGASDVTGEISFTVTIAGTQKTASFDTKVVAEGPALEEKIVKTVGFEKSEGFKSAQYNFSNEKTIGSTDGNKWKAVSAHSTIDKKISGSMSMRFRYYTTVPYAYTDFSISNATKMTFKAQNENNANVIVQYSVDGGSTWTGDETITLSSSVSEYTYELPNTVESCSFKFTYDGAKKTKRGFWIDDVNFYGLA